MHFPKGQLPPVHGFWSLTMYDAKYFFVSNPINRYSISARQNLKSNPDGSTDLYIQKDSPGTDKESNWLPAPAGKFILMLRMYWPNESKPVDHQWQLDHSRGEKSRLTIVQRLDYARVICRMIRMTALVAAVMA